MKKLTDEKIELIKATIGAGNVMEEEPMKLHTSMEVGGPAAYFFTPETEEDLAFVIKTLTAENYPFYLKGNGSNIIVRDEGYDGAIVETRKLLDVIIDGTTVTAQAGILLKDLSDRILEASLTGFEFASGIPGSLGGAVCMDAGAYDGEMRDIIKTVKLLDKEGNNVEKNNKEMDFAYRHSCCSDGSFIVLSAVLELKEGNYDEIKAKIDDLTAKREEKQPLEYPSCGSTFKRPEGYFAGKLITDAGLKGFRLGGAQVSDKHAGFVINKDHATATEILALIRHVQDTVFEKFGVKLECEVKVL